MHCNPRLETSARTSVAPLRVMVVDDHPLVREGLATFIASQKDLACCAVLGSGDEVFEAVLAQGPDLILLDFRLGSADGFELIKALTTRFAGVRILVISVFDQVLYAERVLRAGAMGYIMKERATDDILDAIRAVGDGRFYLSPGFTPAMLSQNGVTTFPACDDLTISSSSSHD